jgi:lipopolysaccharide/colanic/teichoic acid biosynthesis glycosyltransferase
MSLQIPIDKTVHEPMYLAFKSRLDQLFSILLLVPCLPIIIALLAVVRATSPGPSLFRQIRVGKNGVLFTIYKIRTMRIDAEPVGSKPAWAQPRDPRATTLGRFLRDTHLDELPQLFNVFKGEMALVGPRPERPEFVAVLKQEIPDYAERLDVLPGITGLAQLNLPPDSDLNSVRKKIRLDRAYIRELSFELDLRLLLCTFVSLIGWRKERVVQWFKLDRPDCDNTDLAFALRPKDIGFWTPVSQESLEHQLDSTQSQLQSVESR